jgi:hypothetical protein
VHNYICVFCSLSTAAPSRHINIANSCPLQVGARPAVHVHSVEVGCYWLDMASFCTATDCQRCVHIWLIQPICDRLGLETSFLLPQLSCQLFTYYKRQVTTLGALMLMPPPLLDTVTLRPAPSNTVMIRLTNIFILRQSDPTGVGQSDHTQTAQFDPLEVGLNVGCDNLTHVQSDPFSAPPGGRVQFGQRHTDGAVKKQRCAARENFTHARVSRAQA